MIITTRIPVCDTLCETQQGRVFTSTRYILISRTDFLLINKVHPCQPEGNPCGQHTMVYQKAFLAVNLARRNPSWLQDCRFRDLSLVPFARYLVPPGSASCQFFGEKKGRYPGTAPI
jgi:hypothetical protein